MVVNPSLKYSVPNAGDFNAMQANARALCNAYLTKYPELRDGFTTILAHAVDPSGRDVVGIVPLKAYQADRQPAPFPTGITAMVPRFRCGCVPRPPPPRLLPLLPAMLRRPMFPRAVSLRLLWSPAATIPSACGCSRKRSICRPPWWIRDSA